LRPARQPPAAWRRAWRWLLAAVGQRCLSAPCMRCPCRHGMDAALHIGVRDDGGLPAPPAATAHASPPWAGPVHASPPAPVSCRRRRASVRARQQQQACPGPRRVPPHLASLPAFPAVYAVGLYVDAAAARRALSRHRGRPSSQVAADQGVLQGGCRGGCPPACPPACAACLPGLKAQMGRCTRPAHTSTTHAPPPHTHTHTPLAPTR
jgi:hypothetical protein